MSSFSPKFEIKQIRIGTIESASCFNMGNNLPVGFESFKKTTQGFGSITGDNNNLEDLFSKVKDANLIDMLNFPDDEEIPLWVKGLLKSKLKGKSCKASLENLCDETCECVCIECEDDADKCSKKKKSCCKD